MNSFIEALAAAMQKKENKTSAYDTLATVTRIDGNTAYVHIDGGAEETPCQLTISAKIGDIVKIRVSGGKAWITGNFTAPPTDDSAVKALEESTNVEVNRLEIKTDNASKTATNFMSFNGQYGEGLTIGNLLGAALGRNAYIDSDGFHVRNGTEDVASFEEDEVVLAEGKLEISCFNGDGITSVHINCRDTSGTSTPKGLITIDAPDGVQLSGNDITILESTINSTYVKDESEIYAYAKKVFEDYAEIVVSAHIVRTSTAMDGSTNTKLFKVDISDVTEFAVCILNIYPLSYYGKSTNSASSFPMAYMAKSGNVYVWQPSTPSNPSEFYINGSIFIMTD